jgi:hypothetical protein
MIFPYVRHLVEESSAIPSGEVDRPEIVLRIAGPGGTIEVVGLIDTGADHVFLPASLAELLGVSFDTAPNEGAESAGGHALRVFPGQVEIELVGDGNDIDGRSKRDLLKATLALLPRISVMPAFWSIFAPRSMVRRRPLNWSRTIILLHSMNKRIASIAHQLGAKHVCTLPSTSSGAFGAARLAALMTIIRLSNDKHRRQETRCKRD